MIQKVFNIHCYLSYLVKVYYMFVLPKILTLKGIELNRSVKFMGSPIISMVPNSSILLCDNVTLCSESSLTDLGVNHAVVIRTLREGAKVIIGENSGISGGSFCSAVSIEIGANCLIGANVTITDSDFHPTKPQNRRFNTNTSDIMCAPVVIKDNVFIGTGSIILKGVTVGENSVIGAGSIVTKSFPPNSIIAGNPARLIKLLVVD